MAFMPRQMTPLLSLSGHTASAVSFADVAMIFAIATSAFFRFFVYVPPHAHFEYWLPPRRVSIVGKPMYRVFIMAKIWVYPHACGETAAIFCRSSDDLPAAAAVDFSRVSSCLTASACRALAAATA